MAKDDFKNAAAKLLAQHANKVKKASGSPSAMRSETKSKPVVSSVPRPPVNPPVYLPEPEETNYSFCEPRRHNRLKPGILAGMALLGCAVMVLLIPETIFGLTGNAAVGVFLGAGLGWIISREL